MSLLPSVSGAPSFPSQCGALQVGALLEDGHDPTARDSRGRTPYGVADGKAVRDAFRRSASTRCHSEARKTYVSVKLQRVEQGLHSRRATSGDICMLSHLQIKSMCECDRFMAQNPERWDYSAAGVPSALTEDMAAHQDARDAEKKARHRAKEKVRLRRACQPRRVFLKIVHYTTCACLGDGRLKPSSTLSKADAPELSCPKQSLSQPKALR